MLGEMAASLRTPFNFCEVDNDETEGGRVPRTQTGTWLQQVNKSTCQV